MKKNLFSITAIALAIVTVAFTGSERKTQSYYWFPFDETTYSLQPIPGTVTPSPSSPIYCSGSFDLICAEAYMPVDTETFTQGGLIYRRKKTGPGIIFMVRLFKEAE